MCLKSYDNPIEKFEEQETLKEYLAVLNKKEIFVIKSVIFNGYTIKTLSDKIKIPTKL